MDAALAGTCSTRAPRGGTVSELSSHVELRDYTAHSMPPRFQAELPRFLCSRGTSTWGSVGKKLPRDMPRMRYVHVCLPYQGWSLALLNAERTLACCKVRNC